MHFHKNSYQQVSRSHIMFIFLSTVSAAESHVTRAFCYLDIAANKRLLMCFPALDHTCRELIFTGKEMMAVFTSFYGEKQIVLA